MTGKPEKRVLVAVTGASGSIYAERLIQCLLQSDVGRIYLLVSEAGEAVIRHELGEAPEGFSLVRALNRQIDEKHRERLRVLKNNDLFSPVASGSSCPTHMVVLPSSMGTVGRIAQGISGNLIERSADVMLKQKRPLVICPRETPLSLVHLRNLTSLAEMGVAIVPPMPAFYQGPKSVQDMVDFVVGRVLEMVDVPHDLYTPWNSRMI